ncbi:MAG: hypothetical protein VX772_02880 [Bacteroidota bacterium]|uniref:Secreted protein n=1 Tax=Flagellimonas okinawensis TaxID=3031324 RepID=A0ABT5XU71_9FLAO|nr:hypothetical protein [[Muricauda] okinawensis]MDF0709106.1 hypothetical protein [[Muricauda] okinawensis]MEC8831278.1 hypothetical protein [Bacteroidota bacterium]
MTYKTKSLIYFFCFVAAATLYYVVDKHDEFQDHLNSETYVETNFQDADEFDDDTTEDLEEELK